MSKFLKMRKTHAFILMLVAMFAITAVNAEYFPLFLMESRIQMLSRKKLLAGISTFVQMVVAYPQAPVRSKMAKYCMKISVPLVMAHSEKA